MLVLRKIHARIAENTCSYCGKYMLVLRKIHPRIAENTCFPLDNTCSCRENTFFLWRKMLALVVEKKTSFYIRKYKFLWWKQQSCVR